MSAKNLEFQRRQSKREKAVTLGNTMVPVLKRKSSRWYRYVCLHFMLRCAVLQSLHVGIYTSLNITSGMFKLGLQS